VLYLDGPIGITGLKGIEEREVIGDGFSPDLRMELLCLGHEHSTRLFQREQDTAQTPAPGRLVEDGVKLDVGLNPGTKVFFLGELCRHLLGVYQLFFCDLGQGTVDGEPFQRPTHLDNLNHLVPIGHSDRAYPMTVEGDQALAGQIPHRFPYRGGTDI
jgi:hypothetical protein